MTRLTQWVALGVVLVLAVLGGGWFLLVAPTRSTAVELHAQADDQQVANARARTQVQVLQGQADAVEEQHTRLGEIATLIPDAARLPELIRALTTAAEEGEVEFVSLVPGVPTQVAAPATGGTIGTSDAAASATTTTPAAGAAGTLQALPLTIKVVGGYYQLERYLGALEDLPRALRVTGVALAPGPDPLAAPGADPDTEDGDPLVAVVTAEAYLAAGQAPLPDAVTATGSTAPTGSATTRAPGTAAAPPAAVGPAAPPVPAPAPAPGSAPDLIDG